jgi:hypothetical protein
LKIWQKKATTEKIIAKTWNEVEKSTSEIIGVFQNKLFFDKERTSEMNFLKNTKCHFIGVFNFGDFDEKIN